VFLYFNYYVYQDTPTMEITKDKYSVIYTIDNNLFINDGQLLVENKTSKLIHFFYTGANDQ
jgi:hypothetical protein